MKPDFSKMNGLLTTVVVDVNTKAVLMVAWMNEKSFQKRWPVARRGFGLVPVKNSGIRELPAAIRSEWSV